MDKSSRSLLMTFRPSKDRLELQWSAGRAGNDREARPLEKGVALAEGTGALPSSPTTAHSTVTSVPVTRDATETNSD